MGGTTQNLDLLLNEFDANSSYRINDANEVEIQHPTVPVDEKDLDEEDWIGFLSGEALFEGCGPRFRDLDFSSFSGALDFALVSLVSISSTVLPPVQLPVAELYKPPPGQFFNTA